jgi:hypothetical protein
MEHQTNRFEEIIIPSQESMAITFMAICAQIANKSIDNIGSIL